MQEDLGREETVWIINDIRLFHHCEWSDAYLHKTSDYQENQEREERGAHPFEVSLGLERVQSQTDYNGRGQEECLNDD